MKWKKLLLFLALALALIITTGVLANDSMVLVSDEGSEILVYGPLTDPPTGIDDPAWGDAANAVLTWKHPLWQDPTDPAYGLLGAKWISSAYLTEPPYIASTWRKFSKTINLCTGAYNISGTVTSTGDDADQAYINGELIGEGFDWPTISEYSFSSPPTDSLSLEFILENYPGGDDPLLNPAGLIFKATVDYDCPISVSIDIKPGSYPSCFNNNGRGKIPVALFGSNDFDVYQINIKTIDLEGLSVAKVGKTEKYLAAYEDINKDGFIDLVVKFEDIVATFPAGHGFATLTGELMDGTHFTGTGDICITQFTYR